MKTYKFTGTFMNGNHDDTYTIEVFAMGIYSAYFLLMADAIRSGRHNKLNHIQDEKGITTYARNIKAEDIFC